MKQAVYVLALLLAAVSVHAQELNTSKMTQSGQSGASEESRYVLGLVKNGRADLLNKYFDNAPWKIQTEIEVYKDTAKNAAVGVFCVAVDLGNVDVVKAFVEHGLGPADLCRVQTFSTKRVIVSKADRYINESSSSSSKTGASGSYKKSWFRSSGTYKGESTTTSSHSRTEEYHQVAYGEKKVVKTYFANPLDFASDEMFDYLWSQGFRSNNLFTVQALADAKATGKREVYDYILANKPDVLGTKPEYISQATYAKLLEAAKKNPDSLATELLIRNTLGKVKTSKEAQTTKGNVEGLMQSNLASQVADTVGYSAVMRDLTIKEEELAKKEAAAKAAREKAAAEAKAKAEKEKNEQRIAQLRVKMKKAKTQGELREILTRYLGYECNPKHERVKAEILEVRIHKNAEVIRLKLHDRKHGTFVGFFDTEGRVTYLEESQAVLSGYMKLWSRE